MKDPAVLFYTGDFLIGVMDMSMEERGQYITLLCYQHQKGHIPEETIRLLVGSVSVSVLDKFEKDDNGRYFNVRMEEEREKRVNFVKSRQENGKLGGRPKNIKPIGKPNGYPNGKPIGKAKDNLSENENDSENKDDIVIKKHKYGEHKNVLLTDDEVTKLKADLGKDYESMLSKFSESIAIKDYGYKNHNLAIRKWYRDKKENNKESGGTDFGNVKTDEKGWTI